MSVGVRELTVLDKFKPFGLIAEALDGKPDENFVDKFNYFVFDPKITREREDYESSASDSWNESDHELFIRGNRIIWSSATRVIRRFTLESHYGMLELSGCLDRTSSLCFMSRHSDSIQCRWVQPSKDWVQSQVPEIVKTVITNLGDEESNFDEIDAEALVQAYVNIVAGACISIGLSYAGTRNGNAQELLYNYTIYFLNEIKPLSMTSSKGLPKGLSKFVDRGTLEICLHLVVLSLSVVMAGSVHLQTFRLLRFLRSRNSRDRHANYGIQMAVSLGIGFLFLGGGMRSFSTGNGSITSLLITLYPRLPTGPNDNCCHLQGFRHLYVLSTEARWLQTVDVDTGLPVYAPLEVTIAETEHYAETSFCEVTPCILPERAVLKTVRVCGPRYWPQVIELIPEDKPVWFSGDRSDQYTVYSILREKWSMLLCGLWMTRWDPSQCYHEPFTRL